MHKTILLLSTLIITFLSTAAARAETLADGEYFIKIVNTGKYLAVEGMSPANGAALVQWDFANQDNHKFIVKKTWMELLILSRPNIVEGFSTLKEPTNMKVPELFSGTTLELIT